MEFTSRKNLQQADARSFRTGGKNKTKCCFASKDTKQHKQTHILHSRQELWRKATCCL
ncbi:hypothetical protein IB211_02106c [Intestinimonas butyriciproducens]|uniref:Uncharacterized protein n=1 Tax=Intestinimonas butyriciproducens TaxID=1297617 RepID=A0A0S2W575_9FIRM|nr:hypothetical protein IB211_02106c [Intestinimonas butyriciproducens]